MVMLHNVGKQILRLVELLKERCSQIANMTQIPNMTHFWMGTLLPGTFQTLHQDIQWSDLML